MIAKKEKAQLKKRNCLFYPLMRDANPHLQLDLQKLCLEKMLSNDKSNNSSNKYYNWNNHTKISVL